MDTLLREFITFSQKSTSWCIEQSDEAAFSVTQYIEHVVKDVERVSQLSQESLDSVRSLRKFVTTKIEATQKTSMRELMGNLMTLSDEHEEMKKFFDPIIEALQFQDRMRQNLENLNSMVSIWQSCRQDLIDGKYPADEWMEFGKYLLEKTTMEDERTIIQKHIPNLPVAENTEEDLQLF